jgi:hypothetical protein
MRGRLKIVGSVRALEVTTGPNGWHPHLHVLVLTESPISDDDRKAYQTLVFRRWQRLITERNKKTGKAYRPPDREHGITFVPSHKDEYIAKLGLADELTRGSWKHSKDLAGYRTPLQVLRDITQARADGKIANSRDVALWTEYADEMRGARQLTWSRGLRRMYSMGDEQTDLELADKEESDPGQQIYVVSAAIWDRSFKNNWRARCQLLAAAELDGWDGVQRVIDRVSGLEPVPF